MDLDLLKDKLITVRFRSSNCVLSLPEIYERVFSDSISDFVSLRPHQRHAWHALLCQLGALACIRAGLAGPPADAPAWERILRALTPDFPDDEPWSLVSSPDRPAFLQPATGPLDALKPVSTPDELDMLVTAKNHDLKGARMVGARPDDWLFALVTLQTMEGFLGAGNFGISRMNGGFANRPGVGIAPPGGVGAHVMRDVRRLIDLHDDLLNRNDEYDEDGPALLWLEQWDGAASLPRNGLHPYYIDVCRRVRLTETVGVIAARIGNSKAMRVRMTKEEGGITGDPWTPVRTGPDLGKALTVDARGFDYRRLADIIAGDGYVRAPLQEFGPGESGDGWRLVCRALARGQGKTEGYHERSVPIPPSAIRNFGTEGGYTRLSGISKERIDNAAAVRSALRFGLMTLFQNGSDMFNPRDPSSERRAAPFLDRFNDLVDADFFERLFDEYVAAEGEPGRLARRAWLLDLFARAKALLKDAEARSPASSVRRYRARVRAAEALERGFHGARTLKGFLEEDRDVA